MRQSKGLKVSRLGRWLVLMLFSSQFAQPIYGKSVNLSAPLPASDPGAGETFYERKGANRTQVTFELIDHRPVFRVRLNASDKAFYFVLDTGSHMTVISTRTAARLNLRGKASGGQATGVGGKFDVIYAVLSSCEIGEVRLNNVPVFIRDVSSQSRVLDGYVGLTFISQFVTSVDYGERLLTLERPEKNIRANSADSQLPIKLTPSGIVTNQVRIDGIEDPLSFIMDTGATVSVLAKGFEARINASKPGDTLRVHGAGGVTEGVATIFLPRLKLGELEQQDLLTAILDLTQISEAARSKQMGIVGGNFLCHFKVVFDFPHRVVRLTPISEDSLARARTATVADQ